MTEKIWFITGTTTGLGREWAIAALDRGDRVAATARNVDRIADLVDDLRRSSAPDRARCHRPACRLRRGGRGTPALRAPRRGREQRRLRAVRHGRGALRAGHARPDRHQPVRRDLGDAGGAALLREQGSGHILQVASVGGLMAGPTLGIYHASKWALEGISESLAQEVRDFGIKVTIVEPTGYATAAEGSARHATPNPAYAPQRERFAGNRAAGRPATATRRPRVPRSLPSSTPRSRRCGSSSVTDRCRC